MSPGSASTESGRRDRTLEPGEDGYWIYERHLPRNPGRASQRCLTCADQFRRWERADRRDRVRSAYESACLLVSLFPFAGRLGVLAEASTPTVCGSSYGHGMTVGTHGMDHRPVAPALRAPSGAGARGGPRAVIADLVGRPDAEAAVPFGAYDRRLLAEPGTSATRMSTRATAPLHSRTHGFSRVFSVVAIRYRRDAQERAARAPIAACSSPQAAIKGRSEASTLTLRARGVVPALLGSSRVTAWHRRSSSSRSATGS